MSFNSIPALQQKLKADISSAMSGEMSRVAREVLKRFIQSNVYSVHSPSSYGRTYQLLNAVDIKDISTGHTHSKFTLWVDPSKISAGIASSGGWNIHASVWGSDESANIPIWTDQGTSGSLWDRPAGNYIEDSYMELNGGKLSNILASRLRGSGWNVG